MESHEDDLQRQQVWDRVGSGYAARYELSEVRLAPVSTWLVGRADPQPGQVVLDLAAGTGGLGHGVANRVGPQDG